MIYHQICHASRDDTGFTRTGAGGIPIVPLYEEQQPAAALGLND